MSIVRKIYAKFMNDSLYRNSIYLMSSTFIMSILGFLAWVIISKFYTPEEVGLATTIISLMGLITGFSLLGMNSGIIRFLPKSERKNEKINTVFTLISIVTIIVSTLFLLNLDFISPSLLFIRQNIIYSLIFIVFMIFASLNGVIDSVFMAYRSTGYILLKNFIFSVSKLWIPIFLVPLGAYGIFGSWMISIILGFLTVLGILIFKFDYIPKYVFHDSIIQKIGRYSFGNYLAGFISGLPAMLLPLMITNLNHPEWTAYYYMAMMIASALYTIPQSATSSLFAEGSNNETQIRNYITKAIKIIVILLIPAVILTFLLGGYVLSFFGKEYASEGLQLLKLLTLSSLVIGVNSIYGALFKVKKQVKKIIAISIINSVTVIALSYFFITNNYEFYMIGVAYICGQLVQMVFSIILYEKTNKKSR